MSNSTQFLNEFNRIERHLKEIAGNRGDRYIAFRELVSIVSKSNRIISRFEKQLREYGDLRNAIVHESIDNSVIAEPNDKAVSEIKHIASQLLKPPNVMSLPKTEVKIVLTSDKIDLAVKLMFGKSISQIPVFDDVKFVGLLTTNTVSRWLGSGIDDDGILSIKETEIAEVLQYTEDENNHVFLNKSATLFEAVDFFEDYEVKGKRLDAILITENGKRTEKILGIITVSDLPKIFKKISRTH